MKTLKAPRNNFCRSAASIPALLVLGTLSGSALAATESPCPESAHASDVLHAFIERDAASSVIVETVNANETLPSAPAADSRADDTLEPDELSSTDEGEVKESPVPEFTTRLPGVAVNDLPGFRRHMFRTDI